MMDEAGDISLWFGEESGFDLNAHAMYAWQAPDSGRFVNVHFEHFGLCQATRKGRIL